MPFCFSHANYRSSHIWLRGFRGAVILFATAIILYDITGLSQIDPAAGALLLGLIILSRWVPVAISREKPITFTASFVFAAAMLVGAPAAGICAIVACAIHSQNSHRSSRLYSIFLGGQFTLAAWASQTFFYKFTGFPHISPHPGWREIVALMGAASLFSLINGIIVSLGNVGSRYARRNYAEPVLRAQALAYMVSFPFATLMVLAYRAFGLTSLPILATLLLVCAHAVRMTVDNRNLKRQIWALEQLGRTCVSGVNAEMPLQRFLSLSRELVSFDRGVLWVSDDTNSTLEPRTVYPETANLPSNTEASPDSILLRAAQRTTPMLIADASRDPRQPAGTDAASWLLYPIVMQGRTIAVAQFSRSISRPFTQTEANRLAPLVPQAAVAFESVHVRYLMHRYQNMATTDGLTGLLNHRRSQEVLRLELKRTTRYQHPLAVLMMDVDNFKQFNDTYGHPQGDVLLRSISRIIRNIVRDVDHVGRYGGEEFIVILPETNRTAAILLADRIRSSIEEEWFPAGHGAVVQKTISVGVAAYPEDTARASELIQKADEALYQAKRNGRNCVIAA